MPLLLCMPLSACLLLPQLDVRFNSRMGDEGKAALQAAVRGKGGFELEI